MWQKLLSFFGVSGRYGFPAINSITPTQTTSSITVDQDTSFSSVVVYACIKVLSEAISSLPVRIKETNPTTREISILYNHPLNYMLNREMNQFLTAKNFYASLIILLKTFGNAYAYINRIGTTPVSMDLIYSDAVEPIILKAVDNPNSNEDTLHYNIKVDDEKFKDPIPASDIFHVADLCFDGINGKASLDVASEAIGLSISAEQFGAKYFANGAMMSGFMKFPRPLTNQQRKEYMESNAATLQGLDNSHTIGVLANGEEYISVGNTPQDSQYIEIRKFQLEEITRVFGVPPHMINDLTKASYNNIEMQSLEFSIYTLRPLLENIEAEFNRKILGRNLPNLEIEFNMDSMLRGDSKARAEYLSKLVINGIMNRDEARMAEGWNRIEGGFGANYLTQANLLTDLERQKKLNTE